MSNRLDVPAYRAQLEASLSDCPYISLFANRSLAISGATGMIGSYLIDMLMLANHQLNLNCRVVALGRSETKGRARLPYFDDERFSFIEGSVEAASEIMPACDFIIHLASSTHPRAYAADPIGTVRANVNGLSSMLDLAVRSQESGKIGRLLFASSVEIYGENRGDVGRFDESYLGYIDCNTARACYTESKRLGEALCQGYRSQKDANVVIARIARVYGPTLLPDDSKALSQFINNALNGEDIILKSEGLQEYSYLHVADAATGILAVLLKGSDGNAYNLADEKSDVTLKGLATLLATMAETKVVFQLPDAVESRGFSCATKALLDASKAHGLGWEAHYGIEDGLASTLEILKAIR